MKRIAVHGHRGARALYPENTLPSFTYAIDLGIDAVELDVGVTEDNVPVVCHDPYVNAEICTGPHTGTAVHRLTLAELRQCDCGSLKNPRFPKQQPIPGMPIPKLDEVLDLAARGQFEFDIELKSFPEHPELSPAPEAFAQLVLELIRKHALETRVTILSFDFRVLLAMRRLAPEIRLTAVWAHDAGSFLSVAQNSLADILSPHFTLVTPEQVRAAHAANLQVVSWTANTPEVWQKLVEADVDAIVSDDPAALITYLRERGLR